MWAPSIDLSPTRLSQLNKGDWHTGRQVTKQKVRFINMKSKCIKSKIQKLGNKNKENQRTKSKKEQTKNSKVPNMSKVYTRNNTKNQEPKTRNNGKMDKIMTEEEQEQEMNDKQRDKDRGEDKNLYT